MIEPPWSLYEDGRTLGTTGSEGMIMIDQAYGDAARITLEQGGSAAPISITCRLYGYLEHTAFYGDFPTAAAMLERMKADVEKLLPVPVENAHDIARFHMGLIVFRETY
jgi:hypothetical protein